MSKKGYVTAMALHTSREDISNPYLRALDNFCGGNFQQRKPFLAV